MSYDENASDIEQEKNLQDFHHKVTKSLITKGMASKKLSEAHWNSNKRRDDDTDDDDVSESDHFLAKGAFLLTPSYELSMERAASICEKMSFKGCFSLTKTATGILFKFSHPDDYQAVFKKGFHKVTGARFYRKVAIPCRPQKTFTLFVMDVPEDLPVEDIRHALYKFNSVVEVVRVIVHHSLPTKPIKEPEDGTSTPTKHESEPPSRPINKEAMPPLIRVTMASLDEFNVLLQNGLNFYEATFFPTEGNLPVTSGKIVYKKRMMDGSIPGRVRELYPVFDAAGFCKIPAPPTKTIKPIPMRP